jgi:hypothetical protein
MTTLTPVRVARNRWMDWKPKAATMAECPREMPTKPSKLGSVGFEGALPAETSIKKREVVEPTVPANVASVVAASTSAGICVVEWILKDPPVAIETCAVVTDTALFARSTLEQLRIALTQPKRWVGWSVPQLVDRLAQVGVLVALETISQDMEEA